MQLRHRLAAEMFGTFWLVLGGCGAAVLAAGYPGVGIGFVGVSLAFGLTVVTMAYAIGHISGCHLNPAVSLGLAAAGRFPKREVLPYMAAQVMAAVLAIAVLAYLASGSPSFDLQQHGIAANGYGSASPGGYTLGAALVAEVLLTFFFVFVILGATDSRAPAALAPLAIGLCLTLIHLVSIPITNTSVNPARATGPAMLLGGQALQQLWLFWVAPLAGGLLAGWTYPRLARATRTPSPQPTL